jgi:hypothetical protein
MATWDCSCWENTPRSSAIVFELLSSKYPKDVTSAECWLDQWLGLSAANVSLTDQISVPGWLCTAFTGP